MTRLLSGSLCLSIAWGLMPTTALAQISVAAQSGDWNTGSTWVNSVIPSSISDVYVGDSYWPGGTSVARVTLTQNESAANVYLGFGSGYSGTLDLGNNNLTITGTLYLGRSDDLAGGVGSIVEGPRGSFTASQMIIGSGSAITFGANDVVSGDLTINGSATTSASGNAPGQVSVNGTLNLGTNLVTNTVVVGDTSSTLNLNGYNLNAQSVYLGWSGQYQVDVNRGGSGGTIVAGNVYSANNSLNVLSTDQITNLYLVNSSTTLHGNVQNLYAEEYDSVSTAADGNVSGGVTLGRFSTLTLGANLSLSGTLEIDQLAAGVNASGFAITSNQLTVNLGGVSSASLNNTSMVETNNLLLVNGSQLYVGGNVIVNNEISITAGPNGTSALVVVESGGVGLTFNGSSLVLDGGGLVLEGQSGWLFRWADPAAGGNWVSMLESMIADGQIQIDAPKYSVIDQGGYTYIADGLPPAPVPEPSSLLLTIIASLGVTCGLCVNRRRRALPVNLPTHRIKRLCPRSQ